MLDQLSTDDLKQQLQEKEQTVATLTGYLEQAASKLNNLKERPAQAFDPEMVQRQMLLVSQLQTAVEEWEELQVPAVMSRLSSGLDNLRETILDGLATGTPPFGMGGYGQMPAEGDSSPDSESDRELGDALAGWEALKAEMLGEEPAAAKDRDDDVDLQAELNVLAHRPDAVDRECDDREVWAEAVDSREEYIISLIRALRLVENRRLGQPDWDSFLLAPPSLREQVARLSAEFQQMLRTGEVELSIERARISRQESVIAQQRREIDKAQKKQGVNPQLDTAKPAPTGEGRWQKFLGRGNS